MEISVVIPLVEHRLEHLSACLESLARTLPAKWRGEIILAGKVSDALRRSFPSSVIVSEVEGPANVPPNLSNLRNAGAKAARSPVLCLLDPATILLPGWLPPMLRLLERAPHAGCIGNVHREPYSGLIDHAGMRFDAEGRPVPAGRNLALLPRETYDRHPIVSLACALVRRSLFEKIGGFDARFTGPLGDIDFCLRAAQAGHRHYVANRSVVYQYADELPFSESPDRSLYEERWGEQARASFQRRQSLRRAPNFAATATPETWEMAREHRRFIRQEIRDEARVGHTYLRKHLHRPWRYNYTRLNRALTQSLRPLPAALPLAPDPAFALPDNQRADDGWLFDPPAQ